MPKAERVAVPVSFVICWPEGVPAEPLPKELYRSLNESGIAATWAIEKPHQVKQLSNAVRQPAVVEIALKLNASASATAMETIARDVECFHAADLDLAAIEVPTSRPRGAFERRFSQLGIRAIIGSTRRGKSTVIRSLPFGICEFTPHVQAPDRRRWLSALGRRSTFEFVNNASPAVVSIDLARTGSTNSRAWRELTGLIDRAADAHRQKTARILTITELAAILSRQSSSRPQRSILRTAA
jgi:hypothetical protein